jgi:Na+/H+ antiporter NhaC
MDFETLLTVILMGLLVFFSLDFDRHYAGAVHNAARHPFARLLAGLGVIYLADKNPLLAVIALVVVFFWIADVNLLSSFTL